MKFSQRIGQTSITKSIQIDSLDLNLKNGLWNGIKICILDNLSISSQYSEETDFHKFCLLLWHQHFKLPIDEIPENKKHSEHFIRDKFYNVQWYETYDLIEFIANIDFNSSKIETDNFKTFCNEIFERDFSGYRFIDNIISPITNQSEINEIEIAIDTSGQFTSLKGVNIHLKSALDKLSDKINPDYRNSIKESISAIESVAKVISDNTKDTLGGAIDKIKGIIKLHPSLERGFKQLYGYTSDADGIRHGLMDETNCDFEDAKYMLVSSSAFINYLIVKSKKAHVKFK